MDLTKLLKYYTKNILGWKTKRKIVVFTVDDYGNVRVASKQARQKMDEDGLKRISHFDVYDTLETEEDLLALFEVLNSVKDKNNHSAVFTPFALSSNINFEAMRENGFEEYVYENLPETFNKINGNSNVYKLWLQGIEEGIFVPEFHGREHLNIKVLMYLLKLHNKEVKSCFENRSYTSISSRPFSRINFTAALGYHDYVENEQLKLIVKDGLDQFEKVFGFRSIYLTSPNSPESDCLHPTLFESGIKYIDAPIVKKQLIQDNKTHISFQYSGKSNNNNQRYLVRNAVFEPQADSRINWVEYGLKQIEIGFTMHRPVNISSHRVNFCGHVDPNVRKFGLQNLKALLEGIVKRWPDVEFMSAREMITALEKENT
jgi:hypothetical protein